MSGLPHTSRQVLLPVLLAGSQICRVPLVELNPGSAKIRMKLPGCMADGVPLAGSKALLLLLLLVESAAGGGEG